MLCKRALRPQDATPIVWPQITQSPAAANEQAGSSAQAAELSRQLSELRIAHEAELGRVRASAFEEGMRQGREEVANVTRDAAQKVASTVAELIGSKRKLRLDAEREIVKLSLAIARRILNRELATDPDAIEGVVHAALCKLQARDVWQIRVAPAAAEITRAYVERAGFGGAVKINIDPALQLGDLVIDTSTGELDASVHTQLQEIERGFAERLAVR
jgi:flagellar assembly protein FliH